MLDQRRQPAEEFARSLGVYLASMLHQALRLTDWPDISRLPAFLASRYAYSRATIAGRSCLFMAAVSRESGTPAQIAKDIALVQRSFRGIVAYAAPRMNSYQRASLITHGVPFAVPGKQLYIPQLAVDLREHFSSRPSSPGERLSPVSQAALFHHVLGRNPALTTPSTLGRALSYSAMSVGRAFDELASFDLAWIKTVGREKHLSFERTPQELVEAACPYLRSPVRKTYFVRGTPETGALKRSGETALAELSMISPPATEVFATGRVDFRRVLASLHAQQTEHEDEADAAIDIWHYDPAVLSDSKVVDILSLYAQFRNHPDERVAGAAADLLDRLRW